MRKRSWMAAGLLAAALLAGCGGDKKTAATMHLVQTKGTVAVQDEKEKAVSPTENLGLYSGYQVGTEAASYAWIDLDEVKLAKMDEDSEIEIQKSEDKKKLEIDVRSGGLFFNVTEPLGEDESMEIRTSTMITGIRGTCGWMERGEDYSRLGLLEGTVECRTPKGGSVAVEAGQMAVLADGETQIQVRPLSREDVPDFVLEEAGELTAGLPAGTDEESGPETEGSGETAGEDGQENETVQYYDPEVGLEMPELPQDGIERRSLEAEDGAELKELAMNADLSNTELYLGDGTYEVQYLNFQGFENLSIIGTGKTRLVTTNGDELILSAYNCKNLLLYGLIMGHELPPEISECTAGVVLFHNCEDVKLEGCDIYGCGLTGLSGSNSSIMARRTVIRDCSDEALYWLGGDGELRFEECAFVGNGEAPLFGGTAGNTSFTLENCIMQENQSSEKYRFYDREDVSWEESGTRESGNAWQ